MLRKIFFSVAVCLFLAGTAFAQTGSLSGTVTDQNTGDPIPGANIFIEELERGTATDADGEFVIDDIPYDTYVISITFVGYQDYTEQIEIDEAETTVDVSLSSDAIGLDEVVVTGVGGETKREKTTFTIDRVRSDQLENAPTASAGESLTGKVAGVSVVRTSGTPGSGTNITLRGTGSVQGSNQPLYIVDGVILSGSDVDIEPQDIEDIEVVKGAAAASLYGSRAQNGIINITTKSGSALGLGETEVTVRSRYGANQLQNTVDVNESHWFQTNDSGEWLDSDGNVTNFDGAATDDFAPGVTFSDNEYPGETYDNLDRFFDPGSYYENYISVAQNLSETNFQASVSNRSETGVVSGLKGYDRTSVRLNLRHEISSALDFSVNGNYVTSFRDDPQVGGMPNPFFGLLFQFPNIDLSADSDGDGLPDVQPSIRLLEENPLYGVRSESEAINERSRMIGGFNGRYQPNSWFTLEGNVSYDRLEMDNEDYLPLGFQSIDAGTETGYYNRNHGIDKALNASLTAALFQDFGRLSTETRFRALIEEASFESTTAEAEVFITEGVKNLSATDPDSRDADSYSEEIRSRGFFAITNLDYDDKFIIDLMVRRDGSSLFGADRKWHTYYRASGAYRLSEEDWWFAPDLINEFKVRYSLGTAGARPTFSAQYETFNVGVGSITKGTLGNPELKPEFTTEQEFGVDIGIAERMFLELTYAKSDVEDQLLNVPLPSFFGYSSQWQNAGKVETNTFEATLDGTLIDSGDMLLSLGATFDMTDQTITEFDLPAFRTGPQSAFYNREGEVFGAMYGTKWKTSFSELPSGADQNAFDINDDGYLVYVGSGNSYEDGVEQGLWGTTETINGVTYDWGMPIVDRTEDGSTFQKIGDVVPDFNLGFSTTFNYKGLGVYMVWDAQVGGDLYNHTRQYPLRDNLGGEVDQAGKSDAEKKPVQYYQKLYNVNAPSSHFVEDGSYVKLRELSFDYSLGSSRLTSIFGSSIGNALKEVSVGISGRNLLTFTNYSGYDPEVQSNGFRIDSFSYPVYRTFTGQVEFKF